MNGKPHIYFSQDRWLCGHGFTKCSGKSPGQAYRFWQTVQQSQIDYLKNHLSFLVDKRSGLARDLMAEPTIRYPSPSPTALAAKD